MSQTARPIDVFDYWNKQGHLLLSPPYQRGDVWGNTRRRNLIKSILLGVPIPSIIVNDRFAGNWDETVAVIDGKQRITTILMFLNSDLSVPGEWFDVWGEVTYAQLPLPQQRRFKTIPLQVCEGQLPNIESEIEVFELVNFGGVAQGETDL